MKALIVNDNRIAQVEPDNKTFQVVPAWRWIDCPSNCTPEWTYDGNEFHEPVIVTPTPTKQELLDRITVTTQSGKVFDGNMDARNNMMAAIKAAEIIGQLESDWKLADNSIANVTLDELNEALALAIQAAGQIYLNS